MRPQDKQACVERPSQRAQGEWKVTREILSTSGGYTNGYNVFVGNVFIGGYMGQDVDLTQPVEIKGALIAAAPKLLEALEVCLGHMTGGMDGNWADVDPIELARSTIAAATVQS